MKDPKTSKTIGPLYRAFVHTTDLLREAQNNHLKAQTVGQEIMFLRTVVELSGQLSMTADSLSRALKSFGDEEEEPK